MVTPVCYVERVLMEHAEQRLMHRAGRLVLIGFGTLWAI